MIARPPEPSRARRRSLAHLALWLLPLTSPLLACSGDAAETAAETSDATTAASTSGTTAGTGASTHDSSATTTAAASDAGTSDTSTSASTSDASGSSTTSSATASTSTGDVTSDATTLATGSVSTTDASTSGGQGLGELAGDCGLIDAAALMSDQPLVLTNAIDFGDIGFDYDMLTDDAKAVFDDDNLNPGSLHSETIAFEILARCDMAALLKTEPDILYQDPMGKRTDLLVDIDGLKVGVSVTRAYGFPPDDPYTVQQAEELLTDKLADVLASSANVAPEDAWIKQILHVLAYEDMHAESVQTAYAGLPANLTADTIVVVSVTHGDDEFIY